MNVRDIEATEYRSPKHEVLPLLVDRWSPRAMSGQALSGDELASLFEAARWAPSSYNGQPWRFLYARRGSEHWQQFLDLLVDFNRQWAENAAVLIVILSRKTFENNGKPAPTHSFDTGAAWQNLALQGHALGLVVHGMAGFDYDRARDALDVPSEYDVEAMVAVGRPAEIEVLPEELREQELPPSDRKEIAEIAFHGPMPRDP
jgi:nitroreductase